MNARHSARSTGVAAGIRDCATGKPFSLTSLTQSDNIQQHDSGTLPRDFFVKSSGEASVAQPAANPLTIGRNIVSPKRTIKARDIVNDIRAHLSDAQLMEKYGLSAKGLESMFTKLLSIQAISQTEMDRRPAACSDTVVIRQLTAGELLQEIRSGVSDFELMERYGLSSKGLEKAFRTLIKAGAIKEEELRSRSQSFYDTVFIESMREMPRYYLALTVEIYEATRPRNKGKLRDITEQGVGITGIPAKVGEVKTFVIPADKFIDVSRIVFDAECIWTEQEGPGGRVAAGFRLASISEQALTDLKALVRAVAFDC